MHVYTRTSVAVALALAAVVGATAADEVAVTPADDAGPPVEAVWVEHQLDFTYFGRTTFYSCDGLRDKVRHVLRAVGARPDLKVRVTCSYPTSAVEPMPLVRIKVALPQPATPELLERLASDPKAALVARATGKDPAAATARFPAVYRTVEFEGRRSGRIGPGDCELLEHLQREVLLPLGIEELPDTRLGCVPRALPVGAVRLRVQALHAAPTPDASRGRS